MKWIVPTLATMAFAAGTMFNAAHAAQDSQFVTAVPADALPTNGSHGRRACDENDRDWCPQ